MALTVPGTRTVTVVRRGSPTRGPRGEAVYTEQRVDVPGCSVQPSSGTETDADGRVQVTTTTTIYAPLSFPAGPVDAVEFDGFRWEVQGRPSRWEHPRLGHVVVTVQEASG